MAFQDEPDLYAFHFVIIPSVLICSNLSRSLSKCMYVLTSLGISAVVFMSATKICCDGVVRQLILVHFHYSFIVSDNNW